MTVQDYSLAWSFIAAIAGDPATAVIDWRALHDTDKGAEGHARRGTLPEWWQWLCQMNGAGYGIFCTIAEMDGVGRHLANVRTIRAHYIDLDAEDSEQRFQEASRFVPAPWFAASSSAILNDDGTVKRRKYHVYWPVAQYAGNDRFQLVQRKLRQLFNADKAVIDASRVMRVPGTLHMKRPDQPHLVQCWSLAGYGQPITIEALEAALAAVNVIDGASGQRHDLGEPSLAAPSLDWLRYALKLIDPNDLDRGEWIAVTSATKQGGWSLTDEATLRGIWEEWCAQYSANDPAENEKQWNSLRNTEIGWPWMVRRAPGLQAVMTFGGKDRTDQLPPQSGQQAPSGAPPMPGTGEPAAPGVPPMPAPNDLDCSGEYLTHIEQQQWFKGVVFIVTMGAMMTRDGRFLNTSQFNASFGGKKFIVDQAGKQVNEAWQAATRSTLWQVPKVDHIRFLPSREYGELITDELGRVGINTYRPATIGRVAGDPSPFLRHLAAVIPDPRDQKILLDYFAHNIKYPGYKIPWAPVIQSAEGVGKGIFKALMTHAMGRPYVYFPNAKELTNSGSQFNAWMRNKLFILADEIKVDDRRDLIEVLKPMISEELIEVQGKGVDQDLEDNFANWGFFTNYKDAIPVNRNGRRYAIFYSPIQTVQDLELRQMGDWYFKALYDWMKADGAAIVTDFLMNYPIERGAIPMRAPDTSSMAEAVVISRGPIERCIIESAEDNLPGFRGGWVSATMVIRRVKETGAVRGGVSPQTVATILEGMGYTPCGRAPRPYFQEDKDVRSYLYHKPGLADVEAYAPAQGYPA